MSTRSSVVAVGFAFLLFAKAGHGQVVLLDFKGDTNGRLHLELERALDAQGVHLVPLRKYKAEAERRKIRGARQGTTKGVAAMSRILGLKAAVKGTVSSRFHFVVVNPAGKRVSSGNYRLRRGLLSPSDAKRFARTLAEAVGEPAQPPPPAKAAPPPPPPVPPAPPPSVASAEPSAPPTESQPSASKGAEKAGQTLPELDLSPPPSRRAKRLAESQVALEAGEVERKIEEKPPSPRVGPSIITVQVAGLTTWRSYCARPGVSSCKQYDSLPDSQRTGEVAVDFKADAPYGGVLLAMDLFPLAHQAPAIQGLGISASYARGLSSTNLTIQGGSSTNSSSENAFSILGVYRLYFPVSFFADRLPAYLGVRGGFMTRNFNVSASGNSAALGSHRAYPAAGGEGSLPLLRFLRLEAAFNYFFGPKAGSDELARYGGSVKSTGLGIEGGFAGEIWAPIGYNLRFKYARYTDQFSGAGSAWQTGGAAQESYAGLTWGLTASF